MFQRKVFRKAITAGGLALFLLPAPNPFSDFISGLVPSLRAQRFPGRMQRPLMPPAATPAPAAQPVQQPAAATSLPPSMLNQPAQPAEIHFTTATLSIRAENSSLSEILSAISKQSGMKLQGLGSDERVFGSFGPGKPRDVISDLLNGTPYNILMVGDLSDGAPRQLILTPAASSADSTPGISPQPPADTENANADGESTDSAEDSDTDHPKTTQELYQELQNLRQHQRQPQ